MKKEMERAIRSYHFWIAASAFMLLVLKTFGVPIVDEEYNSIVTGGLGLLVMLGILNRDPPDPPKKDASNGDT